MTIQTETLRKLCIDHEWFTNGSKKQYVKLFEANRKGASVAELASMIWMCTDCEALGTNHREIRLTLQEYADSESQW